VPKSDCLTSATKFSIDASLAFSLTPKALGFKAITFLAEVN
jgi:hypothetical protein